MLENSTRLTGWMILTDELFLSIIFLGKSSIGDGNVSLSMWLLNDLQKDCGCTVF